MQDISCMGGALREGIKFFIKNQNKTKNIDNILYFMFNENYKKKIF